MSLDSPKLEKQVRIQEVIAKLDALPKLLLGFGTGQIGNNVCRVVLKRVPCTLELNKVSSSLIKNRRCKKVMILFFKKDFSWPQKTALSKILSYTSYYITSNNKNFLTAIYPAPKKHHPRKKT